MGRKDDVNSTPFASQYYTYDDYGNILNGGASKTLDPTEEAARVEYEEKRLKSFDRHNTAFATPAQCPGLFKYGLKLNPLIYARAMSLKDGAIVDGAENNNQVGSQTPYKIPQCYNKINVVPESIFKIVDAPEDLRPAAGDCNNNFFRLPQLYYEREACNYGMDMYKYDGI